MNLNGFSIAFFVLNAIALLSFPRRWASLPLLIGACYMTLGQGILIGSFNFPVVRMLAAIGLIRVIIRRERLAGGMNGLDWAMVVWSAWALSSSFFHKDETAALIFRFGLVYNVCGIYFLLRVFCQSLDEAVFICRLMAILLIPVAVEMLYEKVAFHNLFSVLGGVPEVPQIREGRIRAFGPFAHPILAGTVGGVFLPLMIGLWEQHRKAAFTGIAVCLLMVYASGSSGPIMSAFFAIVALFMWHWRHRMRLIRWLSVIAYIGLDLVMKVPAYYLLGRIDITGGSTGWHRAELINSAFRHLDEWWLGGTDYTVHWMPTGASWSPNHTDITNHYLQMGVTGGLPLMLLFIGVVAMGFSFVGRTLLRIDGQPIESGFMVWSLGAALFAHAASCISVSYFDQSFIFLYVTLAAISSVYSDSMVTQAGKELSPEEDAA